MLLPTLLVIMLGTGGAVVLLARRLHDRVMEEDLGRRRLQLAGAALRKRLGIEMRDGFRAQV